MQSTQLTAERTFPGGTQRMAEVEYWLGQVLKTWDVRSASTGRWLAGAQHMLERSDELAVMVQYDAALLLFTLEIRRFGHLVYGIDDWLGMDLPGS